MTYHFRQINRFSAFIAVFLAFFKKRGLYSANVSYLGFGGSYPDTDCKKQLQKTFRDIGKPA